jgi:hypothetical protein
MTAAPLPTPPSAAALCPWCRAYSMTPQGCTACGAGRPGFTHGGNSSLDARVPMTREEFTTMLRAMFGATMRREP